MLYGSIGFIIFVGSNVVHTNDMLIIASFINGIGASLIYIGAQQIIVRCTNIYEIKYQLPYNSNIGYFEGILSSTYNISYSMGGILPIILNQHNVSIQTCYIILTIMCLLCILADLECIRNVRAGDLNIDISQCDAYVLRQVLSMIYFLIGILIFVPITIYGIYRTIEFRNTGIYDSFHLIFYYKT